MNGRVEYPEKAVLGYLDTSGKFQEIGGSGEGLNVIEQSTPPSETVSFQWMLGDAGSTAVIPSNGSIVSNFYDFSVLNWATAAIAYISTLSAGTITIEASRNGIVEVIEVSSSEVFTAGESRIIPLSDLMAYHPYLRITLTDTSTTAGTVKAYLVGRGG